MSTQWKQSVFIIYIVDRHICPIHILGKHTQPVCLFQIMRSKLNGYITTYLYEISAVLCQKHFVSFIWIFCWNSQSNRDKAFGIYYYPPLFDCFNAILLNKAWSFLPYDENLLWKSRFLHRLLRTRRAELKIYFRWTVFVSVFAIKSAYFFLYRKWVKTQDAKKSAPKFPHFRNTQTIA